MDPPASRLNCLVRHLSSSAAPVDATMETVLVSAAKPSTAAAQVVKIAGEQLSSIRDAGTLKGERIITGPMGPSLSIAPSVSSAAPSTRVLNFCANNYLGLSNHPALVASAKSALDSHGVGLSSVRFICGTQDLHKQLEATVASFHGMDDAILYSSCFDANAGLFEVLLTEQDAVISDELNHASIIDGIRLCKAQKFRYKHIDMADLEAALQKTQTARQRLIVTDGVFSMDGDVAPLAAICDLADKYSALVFLDECHATGFLGGTGRGTAEHCGVTGRIDIINSTFGKAMGGASGGYTVGPRAVIDLLRQRSRPYLFSNTMPPAIVAASLTAFQMVMRDPSLIGNLRTNTHLFRSKMTAAGFTLKGTWEHPIAPVMLYDAKLASQFAEEMLGAGINVIGFSFPVVPKGQARIRVQISAAHTISDIERCTDAFIRVGKRLSVIP